MTNYMEDGDIYINENKKKTWTERPNWYLELEFLQPNSCLRDRPDWQIFIQNIYNIYFIIDLIL